MKSFAIWCKPNSTNNSSLGTNIDFHINVWDISKRGYIFDFGIKILDFKRFDEICFYIPCKLEFQKEILDLSDKLKNETIGGLIFNSDYTYSASNQNGEKFSEFSITENNQEKKFLVYKFSDDIIIREDKSTSIKFNIKSFRDDKLYAKRENIYIRFRLNSETLSKIILSDIQPKNWFLESAFTSTCILDFKTNVVRNIDSNKLRTMRNDKYELVGFDKLHFLVMEPANNDVTIWGNDFMECRKIEPYWLKYLQDENLSIKNTENLLAYHWKIPKNNSISQYSKLIKISSARTGKIMILTYVSITILIGIIINIISNNITGYKTFNWVILSLYFIFSIILLIIVFKKHKIS